MEILAGIMEFVLDESFSFFILILGFIVYIRDWRNRNQDKEERRYRLRGEYFSSFEKLLVLQLEVTKEQMSNWNEAHDKFIKKFKWELPDWIKSEEEFKKKKIKDIEQELSNLKEQVIATRILKDKKLVQEGSRKRYEKMLKERKANK